MEKQCNIVCLNEYAVIMLHEKPIKHSIFFHLTAKSNTFHHASVFFPPITTCDKHNHSFYTNGITLIFYFYSRYAQIPMLTNTDSLLSFVSHILFFSLFVVNIIHIYLPVAGLLENYMVQNYSLRSRIFIYYCVLDLLSFEYTQIHNKKENIVCCINRLGHRYSFVYG